MSESIIKKTLSPQALKVIDNFLHLPIRGHDISAPYSNNSRAGIRAGLRVLVGKGSPQDIADEALIMSLKDKLDLNTLTNEQLKAWLAQNHIGIDCSGFAYYILDAEARARRQGPLARALVFKPTWNPLRKLIQKLRPVENVGVGTLAHQNNSREIKLAQVAPGDLIVFWRTGTNHLLNHVLIVHDVERHETTPRVIHYSHSFAWSTDGRFNHGARQGAITITDPNNNLLEQSWAEQGKIGAANETYAHAKDAERLEIRRLKMFASG